MRGTRDRERSWGGLSLWAKPWDGGVVPHWPLYVLSSRASVGPL